MFLLDPNFWSIKDTKDRGRGAYTTKDIPAGTLIGDYIGRVYKRSDFTSPHTKDIYDMYLIGDYLVEPDNVTTPGIHLINHSCTPTCGSISYKGHVLYFSVRNIFKGEELTVSYFLDPPNEKDCSPCRHGCRCGSPFCHGTWHLPADLNDEMDEEYDDDKEYIETIAVQEGKLLQPLDAYPESYGDEYEFDITGSLTHSPKTMPDTSLPDKDILIKIIAKTGRTLLFPNLNLHIVGTVRDALVTYTIS